MKNRLMRWVRYQLFVFLCLLLFCPVPAPARAAQIRVAIIPFDMPAQKDLAQLQGGIVDMLSFRIADRDRIEVIDKSETRKVFDAVRGFKGKSRALLVGGKLKADYVLFGSIARQGEKVDINAELIDVAGLQAPLLFTAQAIGLDDVIPKINPFATTINQKFSGGDAPPPNAAAASSSASNTSVVSQVFPGASSWKSQLFAGVITAMDIGDVNNDGSPEIIIAQDNRIEIYGFAENTMQKIAVIGGTPKGTYIGVDVADINGNGIPEIFVDSVAFQQDYFNSFVLEFDGRAFKTIIDRSPWIYRVSRPLKGRPILLGQRRNSARDEKGLFEMPVHKMSFNGEKYVADQPMAKGQRVNVMGSVIDDVMNDGINRLLAYSPGDRLRIYNDGERKAVWQGKDKYGGSLARLMIPAKDPSMGDDIQFFPMRLRTADANADGRVEVIVAANQDMAGIMEKIRLYDKSGLIVMAWDGMELSPVWTSTTIDGRVADYLTGDFDNDGRTEIVAAVILKEKTTAGMKGKSIIIAYDLPLSF